MSVKNLRKCISASRLTVHSVTTQVELEKKYVYLRSRKHWIIIEEALGRGRAARKRIACVESEPDLPDSKCGGQRPRVSNTRAHGRRRPCGYVEKNIIKSLAITKIEIFDQSTVTEMMLRSKSSLFVNSYVPLPARGYWRSVDLPFYGIDRQSLTDFRFLRTDERTNGRKHQRLDYIQPDIKQVLINYPYIGLPSRVGRQW